MIYVIDNGQPFEDHAYPWVEFPERIGDWKESLETVQKIVSIRDEPHTGRYPGRQNYGLYRVMAVVPKVEWVCADWWVNQWHDWLRPQFWLGDPGRYDEETGLWPYPDAPDILDCHPDVLKTLLHYWSAYPLDPDDPDVWPGAFEVFRSKVLGTQAPV
jgi:hypothetical protein